MSLLAMAMSLQGVAAAGEIPLPLPKPDGQPGNPKKPVKVYIPAGQSNMVGMTAAVLAGAGDRSQGTGAPATTQ